MQTSRRAFLAIGSHRKTPVFRPPWARQAADFEVMCSRCDACITICPTHLLQKGDGGFPEAVFSGQAAASCTFCQACVQACPSLALDKQAAATQAAPWSLCVEMCASCLTMQGVVCRTCAELCEVGASRFYPMLGGVAKPKLDSDLCTGCGACLSDCPVGAINMVTRGRDFPPLEGTL